MLFSEELYREHEDRIVNSALLPSELRHERYFKKHYRGKDASEPCFRINSLETHGEYRLQTNYYVGVDWVVEGESAIQVFPKLNDQEEIDFIQILLSCLKHPDVSDEINELFEIDWDKPRINVPQQQDLLTPFLVVEFLGILRHIVRKGLKKSYYRVEANLNNRIKGKVLVGKTIKHNLLKSKHLSTYSSFEKYGFDNNENRLLKKALVFVKRYLAGQENSVNYKKLVDTFNYISPSFDLISEDINMSDLKAIKTNSFYKEYKPALNLAKMILRRFGYNISNTEKSLIQTPPFWIDMSKLFELYVLGLLKDVYGNYVTYHFKTHGNELDYLIDSESYQMVMDAKYKTQWKNQAVHEDVRQVSGYARLTKTYKELGLVYPNSIDCLIIYPDQVDGYESLKGVDLRETIVPAYQGVCKLGVRIPTLR